jgi:hypothetical protein
VNAVLGSHPLWVVAALVFLVNLPFGFWRAGLRKLSPAWFVAVHAPVPIAIGLRLAAGLDFRWQNLPLFVLAYGGGQLVGGRLRRRRSRGGGGLGGRRRL